VVLAARCVRFPNKEALSKRKPVLYRLAVWIKRNWFMAISVNSIYLKAKAK
jgi:hypothetical protein